MKKSLLMACLLGLTFPLSVFADQYPTISKAELAAEQVKEDQKVTIKNSQEKIGEVVLGVGGCKSSTSFLGGNIKISYSAHKCVQNINYKIVTVDPEGWGIFNKDKAARHYILEDSGVKSSSLVMEDVKSGSFSTIETDNLGLAVLDQNGHAQKLSEAVLNQMESNHIRSCKNNTEALQSNLRYSDSEKEMIANCFGIN